CSSLTSWSVRGARWFCLWTLDLVEVRDVGACVMRLWSHVVALGFRELLCLGSCFARVDSAGSAGVIFGLTWVVVESSFASALLEFLLLWLLFEFIAYLTGLNSNPSGSSDSWVAARRSGVPGGGFGRSGRYGGIRAQGSNEICNELITMVVLKKGSECELQESVAAVAGCACFEHGCWFARAAVGFVVSLCVHVGVSRRLREATCGVTFTGARLWSVEPNRVVLVSGCCGIALEVKVHRLVALCSGAVFQNYWLLSCGFSQNGALGVLVEVLSEPVCVASAVCSWHFGWWFPPKLPCVVLVITALSVEMRSADMGCEEEDDPADQPGLCMILNSIFKSVIWLSMRLILLTLGLVPLSLRLFLLTLGLVPLTLRLFLLTLGLVPLTLRLFLLSLRGLNYNWPSPNLIALQYNLIHYYMEIDFDVLCHAIENEPLYICQSVPSTTLRGNDCGQHMVDDPQHRGKCICVEFGDKDWEDSYEDDDDSSESLEEEPGFLEEDPGCSAGSLRRLVLLSDREASTSAGTGLDEAGDFAPRRGPNFLTMVARLEWNREWMKEKREMIEKEVQIGKKLGFLKSQMMLCTFELGIFLEIFSNGCFYLICFLEALQMLLQGSHSNSHT
ncbi:hypothetical protein Taro_002796, partial [Colocasia esculenta]|nr:hypothetical protein [Colocasia esculenta]